MTLQTADAPPVDHPTRNPSAAQGLADPLFDPLFTRAPLTGVPSAWYGHVPFAFWITQTLRPRCLVELGTHNGVSYAAFCDAVLREGLATRCFAVDTWQGDEHAGHYGEDVYTNLRAFHDSRYGAFSELVRSTFDQALEYFEDGSIDLLHIDGCHDYHAVRRDFEHWLPKLSRRAVVLFHDTNVRERHFGVWRFWAELRERYPGFEMLHEHGLGVLAVGPDAPAPVRSLCHADPPTVARLRSRFAFSGRACILEAEIAAARSACQSEQAHSAQARAAVDRLTTQLNDAHGLARAIADARDAALAARDAALQQAATALEAAERETAAIRDQSAPFQREAARLHIIATAQEAAAAPVRAALALTQRQLHATEAALDQASSQLRSAHTQLVTEEHLRQQIAVLQHTVQAFEQSTAWKLTWPLRALGRRVPRVLRDAGRRSLKAAWWGATPLRLNRRLQERRERVEGGVQSVMAAPLPLIGVAAAAPAPAPDAFSLHQLPALGNDFAAQIEWYDPVEPDVSIVVLNWNRAEMTLLCLQHLWQRTTGYRYEIIVVDNGSSGGDVDFLRSAGNLVRVIPLGVNRYFGEANNIGVEAARGRYVCFLNNDVFVHDGWLAPLVDLLEQDPAVGAAGPRFLFPDGRLQEAGALVNPDGAAIQLGNRELPGNPAYDSLRPVDYVSAACLVMRRQDFLDVLGFDLTWDPAYYEDADLCLKLRLQGMSTLYHPASAVTHLQSATSAGSGLELQLHNIVAINRVKFVDRWGAYLRTAGAERPSLIPATVAAAPAPAGKPRVVIFTPYNIMPGGGERYLLTIAEALAGLAVVAVVSPHRFSRLRVLTTGREFGLDLGHVQLFSLPEIYHQPPFDLAFVIGNAIVPPIGRMAAHNIYVCQFPFPLENPDYLRAQRPLLNDFELILTYSDFVRGHVLALLQALTLAERPVQVLAPPVVLLPPSRSKRAQILHVGRFFTGGHCKRQDRLIEVFRTLVAAGATAVLHLAGSTHPEPEHRAYYAGLVESAAGLPVVFHANCSAEALRTLYADSLIYWHATGFDEDVAAHPHKAEHFGISVVEAMSAGCIPVVFGAGGPADVVEDGVSGFHFQTEAELCTRTRTLLEATPPPQLEALAAAAAQAAQGYDEAKFKAQIRALAGRFIAIEAPADPSVCEETAVRLVLAS